MDIEKILEEVRVALGDIEQTGGVGGLEFFNTKGGGAYITEVHIREGKFAVLHIYSREESELQRNRHSVDQDGLDFEAAIATLGREPSPKTKAFYETLLTKTRGDKKE